MSTAAPTYEEFNPGIGADHDGVPLTIETLAKPVETDCIMDCAKCPMRVAGECGIGQDVDIMSMMISARTSGHFDSSPVDPSIRVTRRRSSYPRSRTLSNTSLSSVTSTIPPLSSAFSPVLRAPADEALSAVTCSQTDLALSQSSECRPILDLNERHAHTSVGTDNERIQPSIGVSAEVLPTHTHPYTTTYTDSATPFGVTSSFQGAGAHAQPTLSTVSVSSAAASLVDVGEVLHLRSEVEALRRQLQQLQTLQQSQDVSILSQCEGEAASEDPDTQDAHVCSAACDAQSACSAAASEQCPRHQHQGRRRSHETLPLCDRGCERGEEWGRGRWHGRGHGHECGRGGRGRGGRGGWYSHGHGHGHGHAGRCSRRDSKESRDSRNGSAGRRSDDHNGTSGDSPARAAVLCEYAREGAQPYPLYQLRRAGEHASASSSAPGVVRACDGNDGCDGAPDKDGSVSAEEKEGDRRASSAARSSGKGAGLIPSLASGDLDTPGAFYEPGKHVDKPRRLWDADVRKNLFTWAEIQKHNKRDNCWLVVKDTVYDVTSFLPDHPAGADTIVKYGGTTADRHYNFHPQVARDIWDKYAIGMVDGRERSSECSIM